MLRGLESFLCYFGNERIILLFLKEPPVRMITLNKMRVLHQYVLVYVFGLFLVIQYISLDLCLKEQSRAIINFVGKLVKLF